VCARALLISLFINLYLYLYLHIYIYVLGMGAAGGFPLEGGNDGGGAVGVAAQRGAGAAGDGEPLRAPHVDVHGRHVPRHHLRRGDAPGRAGLSRPDAKWSKGAGCGERKRAELGRTFALSCYQAIHLRAMLITFLVRRCTFEPCPCIHGDV
jgi:hypothetical protein